jgi:hypothetical protein
MTSITKLIALLSLTFFSDFHLAIVQVAKELGSGDKLPYAPSAKNILRDTAKGNTGCFIDTAGILDNQYLPQLIDELTKTKLTIHKTTTGIPSFIMDFLKCSRGGSFSIANPGENWQVTDVVIGDLPERQLLFFGISDSIGLMTHFTGGMGKVGHILIFKFNNKEITRFWCGVANVDPTDKRQVLESLKRIRDKVPRLPENYVYF